MFGLFHFLTGASAHGRPRKQSRPHAWFCVRTSVPTITSAYVAIVCLPLDFCSCVGPQFSAICGSCDVGGGFREQWPRAFARQV